MSAAGGNADETPQKSGDSFTSYAWSFAGAKPPTHFFDDGTVVDGNGTVRYDWSWGNTAKTINLLERGPKQKDKARIEIWFWDDLKGFAWFNHHGNSSGQGVRVEEVAAAADAPPKKAPLPELKNPPSPQLQAFSTSWLEKLIGPLDNASLPRAQLSSLQMDYQVRLPQATPGEKATLQTALQVCTAYGNLMDVREKTVASLAKADATTSASEGSTKSGRFTDHNQTSIDKNEKRERIRAAQYDSRFVAAGAKKSITTQWEQQQASWRNYIQQLLVREKQTEVAELAQLAGSQPPASAAVPSR